MGPELITGLCSGSSARRNLATNTCSCFIQKPHYLVTYSMSSEDAQSNCPPSTPSCLSEDQTGLGFRSRAHLRENQKACAAQSFSRTPARVPKEKDHCSGRELVSDCEVSDWIDWTDCAVSCEGTVGDVDGWPHRNQETLVNLSGDEMRPLTCRLDV